MCPWRAQGDLVTPQFGYAFVRDSLCFELAQCFPLCQSTCLCLYAWVRPRQRASENALAFRSIIWEIVEWRDPF